MRTLHILTALVSLMISMGCGKDAGTPPPSPSAAGAKPASSAATPAKADGEQIAAGLVVRTYNEVLGEVGRSIVDRYLGQVGEKVPPVDKMQHITLSSLGGPWDKLLADSTKALADARTAAPQLTLVAEADALLARTAELGEAFRAAGQYYSSAAYKSDQGAGAGPIHEKFFKALDAFDQAQGKVAVALDAREQDALRREMEGHAATTVSHQYRKALLAAKVLLAARRLDPAGFAAANETFQAEAKALDAFVASKPDAPSLFKNFHRMIQETLAPHAAKLARELNDPKAHPAQVKADRELLSSYYNNLVQATNSLLKAENTGQLK